MTAAPPLASPRPVVLRDVRQGLVDPAGVCTDLDAVLEQARAAEREGAQTVIVPRDGRHWPATAQALAVLLATERVEVVVGVDADAWEAGAVARFAAGATRLAGDRLTVQVGGERAEPFARRLRADWPGRVTLRVT